MNTSDCSNFGFAIIHITEEWKNTQKKRLEAVKFVESDHDLKWLNYADTNVEFFIFSQEHYPEIEQWLEEKSNVYIGLHKEEMKRLITHPNRPHNYQMQVFKNGNAIYNSFGKYVEEEFWTEEFSLEELIK